MADINYPPLDFAHVHGTKDEPITVRVDATEAGWFTITGHPNPMFNGRFAQPTPTDGHSDTIKMSDCCWLRVVVTGRLIGGKEDCWDCNNGSHDCAVWADEWESGGDYVCTLKGGGYTLRAAGKIVKHGRVTDDDLGNWSDQSGDRTRDVSLYHWTADGSAVRVRVLHAWEPYLENGQNQKYERNDGLKGVFYALWSLLKALGIA